MSPILVNELQLLKRHHLFASVARHVNSAAAEAPDPEAKVRAVNQLVGEILTDLGQTLTAEAMTYPKR